MEFKELVGLDNMPSIKAIITEYVDKDTIFVLDSNQAVEFLEKLYVMSETTAIKLAPYVRIDKVEQGEKLFVWRNQSPDGFNL